jgi:hypothetical protein
MQNKLLCILTISLSLNILADDLQISDGPFINLMGISIPSKSKLIMSPDKGRGEIWEFSDKTILQINRLASKQSLNLEDEKKELYLLKKERELTLGSTQILSLKVKNIKKEQFKNYHVISIDGEGAWKDNINFFYKEYIYSFKMNSVQLIYTNNKDIPKPVPVVTKKMEQSLL